VTAAVALKKVEEPKPTAVLSGGQIEGSFWSYLMKGKWVRVTFKDTCQPDDVDKLIDMRNRRFVELTSQSQRNVAAVYIAQDGWGNLSRSFTFRIVDDSGSARDKINGLARRLETLEIFD
jgi:hypothetical protein